MEIRIEFTDTTSAGMVFGSEDLNYRVTMDLFDDNGDGVITVLWDTSVAGQTSDPGNAFSAKATNDEVRNLNRTTSTFEAPIALESYSISLSVGDTETDVGLATVTDPTETQTSSETQTDTETNPTTDEPEDTCTPGHTDGDPPCQQVTDDASVLTAFDAAGTALAVTFDYPCGWRTSTTTQFADRSQANVTRDDFDAYADVQVRTYYEPVSEDFIGQERDSGDYVDVEYEYEGETRTGIVTSPDTSHYGTVGHAAIPYQDDYVHLELLSTLKQAECDIDPRPDYYLVRDMLTSIAPNPESTFSEHSDHF